MSCCSCFRSVGVREKRPSSKLDNSSNQEEKSSEQSFQHISRLEPQFTDLLVRFGLLSNAAEFEKSGNRTIAQVSKMTDKELSFLKPLQRRKFQAAISEAFKEDMGINSPTGNYDGRGSFDSSFVEAYIGDASRLTTQIRDMPIIDMADVAMEKKIKELVGTILRAAAQEEGCSQAIYTLNTMKEKGITKGRSLACAALAFCYRSGHGVEKDDMMSDHLWKMVELDELNELAKGGSQDDSSDSEDFSCGDSFDSYAESAPSVPLGSSSAQFLLGVMDEDGLGCEKDGTRHAKDKFSAARLYLRASKEGNLPCAQHALAVCLFYGDGVPEDKYESVQWDKIAAEQGNAAAQYALGVCYDNGEGVKIDENKAFNYYKLAAKQNYALAQFTLGQCYEYGSGTKEDMEEALKLYSAASSQGNTDAKEAMKALCPSLIVSHATTSALALCRPIFDKPTCLITKQEVDALLTIDNKGNTCEISLARLRKDQASRTCSGHALTIATAATCYYFGYGVEEDYELAQRLWGLVDVDTLTVLSQKGEERTAISSAIKQYAAYLLGGMLIIGQGRAGEDEEEGAILLTRASAPCKVEGSYHSRGMAHAQYSIGACHYYGVGVEDVDEQLGVSYYKKSAAQGHSDAISELERLKVPIPPLLEGLPALIPLKLPAADMTDIDSLMSLLRTLISRFEAMSQRDMEMMVIDQWRFVTERQLTGQVAGNKDFSIEYSKCSAEGLIGVNGQRYRLGTPHISEPTKLKNAQQQVHTFLNQGSEVPQELPELSARAQSILVTFKTHSPVSILAVASVETELSEIEVAAVVKTQALQRGRRVRDIKKKKHLASTLIQASERRRQQLSLVHRDRLLASFSTGVHTGDFLKFIHRTEQSAQVLRNSDLMERASHISTILLAEASVRWLGFTAPRNSKGSMSRFCDFDERSWKSLYWTPYVGKANQTGWLEEEFPFGFLVGEHPESYSETFNGRFCSDELELEPNFKDLLRYSKDLYRYPVDISVPRTWRVHTGKGNFFLVLHLTGPLRSMEFSSGIELSVMNTDLSLIDALVDLNTYSYHDTESSMRHSKVMVFRFSVKGEQPAITLRLAQYVNTEKHTPKHKEEDCGYVSGFEVVMDTTEDSLWWTKSDFYSHTHVEDVDEHELEMEKFRQAEIRTTFEVDQCRRMMLNGTKEGVVSMKRKVSRFEPKYKQKHISFNPVSRLMSCYEIPKTEVEWTRRVTGRASIDHDHPVLGFKVSTCNEGSVTDIVQLMSAGSTQERDEWINFINARDESSHSPPRFSRRHSSGDLATIELDDTPMTVRSSSDDVRSLLRCHSSESVREPVEKSNRSLGRRRPAKSPKSRARSTLSSGPNSPTFPGSRSGSTSPRTGFTKGASARRRASADSVVATKKVHSSRLAPALGRRSPPGRKSK